MRRAVLAVLATLLLCELGLRATGLGPWRPFPEFAEMPSMSVSDKELGWMNRPGEHRWSNASGPVTASILEDGSRAPTGGGPHSVDLFGGSFMFGYGLTDEDALGAQLVRLRPDLVIHNRAVPGFGTVQSFGLHDRSPPADVVIYGLVDLHDGRNAPAGAWLHALERSAGSQDWAAVPGATWDGEHLSWTAPRSYRHWRWSEHSALIDRVERTSVALKDRFFRTKSETTLQVTLRFREAVVSRGGRFVVAILHAPSREDYYRRRLTEEGVEWWDLQHPEYPAWSVPGDGHPDARVHRAWADKIASEL